MVLISFITVLLGLTGNSSAQSACDPRLLPITKNELIVKIHNTPLTSPEQPWLLIRARYAHLLDVAYKQYSQICEEHPDSAYANYLVGLAAEDLITDSMNPDVRRYKSLGHAYVNYTGLADRYLRKSHQLAPKSAIISAEYGFLLWQYESKMDDGLKLIKTAEQRDPNNPRIHAILGLVYANSGGNDYSPADAINELQIAIRKDPHYAFPHGLLSNIYMQKHDAVNQEREDHAFKALLPAPNIK